MGNTSSSAGTHMHMRGLFGISMDIVVEMSTAFTATGRGECEGVCTYGDASLGKRL